MLAAVVPSQNEEKNLGQVLETLRCSKVDVIIPVINGCQDNSLNIIDQGTKKNLIPLVFSNSLGIDVPRSIGAKKALELGADAVVFVDGDMGGPICKQINLLSESVLSGSYDMALTDCYQNYHNYGALAQMVLHFRKKLNQHIGLFETIGVASPSHGPHAVSRKLLKTLPLKELAIPPVSLALAAQNSLKIGVLASIPHCLLGSGLRNQTHVNNIAETIIGDCIEAIEVFTDSPRTRAYKGQVFVGYHNFRDFHTINKILACK